MRYIRFRGFFPSLHAAVFMPFHSTYAAHPTYCFHTLHYKCVWLAKKKLAVINITKTNQENESDMSRFRFILALVADLNLLKLFMFFFFEGLKGFVRTKAPRLPRIPRQGVCRRLPFCSLWLPVRLNCFDDKLSMNLLFSGEEKSLWLSNLESGPCG